ncbi:unnamed protein product, partial [Cyprideis torosa]
QTCVLDYAPSLQATEKVRNLVISLKQRSSKGLRLYPLIRELCTELQELAADEGDRVLNVLKDSFEWWKSIHAVSLREFQPCVLPPCHEYASSLPPSLPRGLPTRLPRGLPAGLPLSCFLCLRSKEGSLLQRFLHCGGSKWAHANCLLYSDQVQETKSGLIQNVEIMLLDGFDRNSTRCSHCNDRRATVPCVFFRECGTLYHLPCAATAGCEPLLSEREFPRRRFIRCPTHALAKSPSEWKK